MQHGRLREQDEGIEGGEMVVLEVQNRALQYNMLVLKLKFKMGAL